jgi:hypothetical protein
MVGQDELARRIMGIERPPWAYYPYAKLNDEEGCMGYVLAVVVEFPVGDFAAILARKRAWNVSDTASDEFIRPCTDSVPYGTEE